MSCKCLGWPFQVFNDFVKDGFGVPGDVRKRSIVLHTSGRWSHNQNQLEMQRSYGIWKTAAGSPVSVHGWPRRIVNSWKTSFGEVVVLDIARWIGDLNPWAFVMAKDWWSSSIQAATVSLHVGTLPSTLSAVWSVFRCSLGQQVGRFAMEIWTGSFEMYCMDGPHCRVPWKRTPLDTSQNWQFPHCVLRVCDSMCYMEDCPGYQSSPFPYKLKAP